MRQERKIAGLGCKYIQSLGTGGDNLAPSLVLGSLVKIPGLGPPLTESDLKAL